MRPLALILVLMLALPACGGGDEGESDVAGPTVVLETDDGEKEIAVEIADTDDERAVGLMGRTSLPEDAGMLFVYPEPTQGGYWMKNTLIPLSIAFYDANGKILRILDMDPCRSDPCRVYDPGVQYTGALEVNQGAFERWGVREGDRLELRAS